MAKKTAAKSDLAQNTATANRRRRTKKRARAADSNQPDLIPGANDIAEPVQKAVDAHRKSMGAKQKAGKQFAISLAGLIEAMTEHDLETVSFADHNGNPKVFHLELEPKVKVETPKKPTEPVDDSEL